MKNFSHLYAYSLWKVCQPVRLFKTVRLSETLEYENYTQNFDFFDPLNWESFWEFWIKRYNIKFPLCIYRKSLSNKTTNGRNWRKKIERNTWTQKFVKKEREWWEAINRDLPPKAPITPLISTQDSQDQMWNFPLFVFNFQFCWGQNCLL